MAFLTDSIFGDATTNAAGSVSSGVTNIPETATSPINSIESAFGGVADFLTNIIGKSAAVYKSVEDANKAIKGTVQPQPVQKITSGTNSTFIYIGIALLVLFVIIFAVRK